MREWLVFLLIGTVASAGDVAGLDAPPKSPLAQRKRESAKASWKKGRAVLEQCSEEKKPTAEQMHKALADLEEAIDLFELAQRMEWSPQANQDEAECVRNWAALRRLAPPIAPPSDPEEKARWEKKQQRVAAERARDARRFLTKFLQGHRHSKVFQRCGRCDGRGELRTAFGDKSVCKSCAGRKLITNRKNLLKAYWMTYSPFYRSDNRNQTRVSEVLRIGVPAEKRIGPFIHSSKIDGKIEDHGWWFRARTKEKVIEEGDQKKPTEREETYVVMNVGSAWWIHGGSFDNVLLKPDEPK